MCGLIITNNRYHHPYFTWIFSGYRESTIFYAVIAAPNTLLMPVPLLFVAKESHLLRLTLLRLTVIIPVWG